MKNSNEKLIRKCVGPFEIDDYEVFQVTKKRFKLFQYLRLYKNIDS